MSLKKRCVRALMLSSSLFFVASCDFNIEFIIGKPLPSSSQSEETSSSLEQQSSSSVEESSSTVDPNDPNKELKTKLSSSYCEYSKHNIANHRYAPSLGSPKLLVVPVLFSDNASSGIRNQYKENVREDIEKTFFGSKEDTGWQSVHTYYDTLSDGRLKLNGVVTEWWDSGISSSEAGENQSKTNSLVLSAVDWYFSKPDAEPRSSFDSDNDGYLDAVVLIYGAPNYHSSRSYDKENLWAYCSWLQTSSDEESPNANAFLWASYDFMYNEMDGYERAGRWIGGGDTRECSLDTHTYIHETGHLLGFYDYYDYSQKYNPAGGFSMQDENVGSHDPFSALAAGWVDPIIPTESTTISIRPFQNKNHDLILLTNVWNEDNSPFDEYILLEFYTPTGLNEFDSLTQYNYSYPVGPSEIGIRLWHVDARLVKGRATALSLTWNKTPFTNPETNNCYMMQSNTSLDTHHPEYFEAYGNILGSSYADYNLLQLIKNDTSATYKIDFGVNLSGDDLFGDGSSFDMRRYSKQFVNKANFNERNHPGEAELNNKDYLGWSFEVSISGEREDAIATINLTKDEY